MRLDLLSAKDRVALVNADDAAGSAYDAVLRLEEENADLRWQCEQMRKHINFLENASDNDWREICRLREKLESVKKIAG